MPVPKKRHSNTRTNKRRANWKINPVRHGVCPACSEPILPHRACPSCGTYQGRQVIKLKEKKGTGKKEK